MAGNSNSGGHNRLSAAEHQRRGTYRADRHGTPGSGRSLADVATCPAHLCGDDTEALWNELAARYDASVEPARIENAALAQAIVRRAYASLPGVPVLDAGRVLRLISRFADMAKGQLVGLRRVEEGTSAADDPFAEFDQPTTGGHDAAN